MIKAVIFDCFGVIYPDTLALVGHLFLEGDTHKREEIRLLRRQCDVGHISRDEFWNATAKILNITRSRLDTELDRVRGADWELLSFIQKLKQSYKTAMLSNVGQGFLERIFDEKRPQNKYFDLVIASGDIGIMKPDPGSYLYVVKQLNVEAEACIFVDDGVINCQGAEAVGMKAILYKDLQQLQQELKLILSSTE